MSTVTLVTLTDARKLGDVYIPIHTKGKKNVKRPRLSKLDTRKIGKEHYVLKEFEVIKSKKTVRFSGINQTKYFNKNDIILPLWWI